MALLRHGTPRLRSWVHRNEHRVRYAVKDGVAHAIRGRKSADVVDAEFLELAQAVVRERPALSAGPAARKAPRDALRLNPAPRAEYETGAARHGRSADQVLLAEVTRRASPELRLAMKDEPNHFHDMLSRVRWAYDAPEGFPPYPRRGTTYTADELTAISRAFITLSPEIRELRRIATEADERVGFTSNARSTTENGKFTLQGIVGHVLADERGNPTTFSSWLRDLLHRFEQSIAGYGHLSGFFRYNNETFKRELQDVTSADWIAEVRESYGRGLADFARRAEILSDPALYDTTMDLYDDTLPQRKLERVKEAGPDYAKRWVDTLYGFRHDRHTDKTPNARIVSGSLTIAEAQQQREQASRKGAEGDAQRDAAAHADIERLARALTGIPKRGLTWTGANIAKVLPDAFKVHKGGISDPNRFIVEGPLYRYSGLGAKKEGASKHALWAAMVQSASGVDLGFSIPFATGATTLDRWNDAEHVAQFADSPPLPPVEPPKALPADLYLTPAQIAEVRRALAYAAKIPGGQAVGLYAGREEPRSALLVLQRERPTRDFDRISIQIRPDGSRHHGSTFGGPVSPAGWIPLKYPKG